MPSTSATPVESLRENAKRLEAALSVGLADPAAKSVHELRSSTRRVEAQIDLLGMVRGLPSYKPAAKKVLRRLSTLRRKAGRVRDCDVQLKLLEDQDRSMISAAEATPDLGKAQEKLRKRITKRRGRHEQRLLAEIKQQLPRLARDTEKLLKSLKESRDLHIPVAALLTEIERRFDPLMQSKKRGEDHLHDLRKALKRARYQCESLPGPQAAAMARRFEQLQDAGGSWHDLLDLAAVCHRDLGPEHPLSRTLEHLRDQHLDHYLADLETFRARHASSTERPHRPTSKPTRSAPTKRKSPRKPSSSTPPTHGTRRH